jgi:hypothetical protein
LIEVVEPEPPGSANGAAIQWEDSDTEEAQDSKTRQRGGLAHQRSATQIIHIPGNEVRHLFHHHIPGNGVWHLFYHSHSGQ